MFQPLADNLNKTAKEQAILNSTVASGIPISGVTLSYQEKLYLIQKHLQTLYGRMADWSKNLGVYLSSPEHNMCTLHVNGIKSVMKLPLEVLYAALEAEHENDRLLQQVYQSFAKWSQDGNVEDLAVAAEILGVLPSKDGRSGINEYYAVFPRCIEERVEIRTKVLRDNVGFLGLITGLIISLYEDGQCVTYPFVQTAITQPRGRIFWRGENAFYGSSKPSITRTFRKESPRVAYAVSKMRQDECGFFLDRFDAVRKWNACNVNYLALMQHYGMPTYMIDITSDLKTALFFACTKWECNDVFQGWKPLVKSDIEKKDSRKFISDMGGDSRYGMIYKARAEIEDLIWLVIDPGKGEERNQEYLDAEKHVIPVGYQPFARTKAQHAYMVVGVKDLYHDARFDKAIFKLDEGFCRWIYEEMDCGNKIYPNADVPDISRYIQRIAKTRVFNKSSFDFYCDGMELTKEGRASLSHELLQFGYIVSDRQVEFASQEEIERINQDYGVEKAMEFADVKVKSTPLMVMT